MLGSQPGCARWPAGVCPGAGLALVVLLAGLALGCATTTSPTDAPASRPAVVVTYSDIDAPRQDDAPDLPELTAEESLEDDEESPSSRAALEQAIAWAAEGLRLYQEGELAAAHKSLEDAHIMLLAADLPEALQERGLAMLSCALPGELAGYDLEALRQRLAATLPSPDAEAVAERHFIEQEVRRLLARFDSRPPSAAYLEVFVGEVERYIDFYQGKHRDFFERAFVRKHKYWPVIEAVFTARRIPVELGYMALVESGFNPRAQSHADARGIWQFIPSTGRRYQLHRREDFYDVAKATEAAAEYLLDLIGIFGSPSFLLATAAYNAGEGRISRCLRDLEDPFGKRSFWEIRGCLAPETREYVPRIMAAVVIGSNPGYFGFDLPDAEAMAQAFDVVTIPAPMSLAQIAELAGTSVAALRTANTDLAPTATRTPVRNFPLYVPSGGGQRLAAALTATPTVQVANRSVPEVSSAAPSTASRAEEDVRGTPLDYTVQAGDTLSEIAERFGVSVADLRRWNPSLRRTLYRGDRLTLYPQADGEAPRVYAVQRGDTLSEIAERFGVRLSELAAANGLRRPYQLQIGQRLEIGRNGNTPPRVVYTVQPGNTLEAIAGIFAVRYRDVMRWNDLRSSLLRSGQRLVIHPPHAVRVENHRVRRGESIARIARRYGVSVDAVLTANGLSPRSLIQPGQELVIYISS